MMNFIKKLAVFFTLISLNFAFAFSKDFIRLKYVPSNIEIELLNVDVAVVETDEDFASYATDLRVGTKLSCVLNRGTFRVRSIYETSGKITIKIPKDQKIERLKISAALSNISINDLDVVHSHILLTRGDLSILNVNFKTSNITHNSGIFNFMANIKSSNIALANSKSTISYLGNHFDYLISYNQTNSQLIVNGKKIFLHQGFLGKTKSRKNVNLTISASVVNLNFPLENSTK